VETPFDAQQPVSEGEPQGAEEQLLARAIHIVEFDAMLVID